MGGGVGRAGHMIYHGPCDEVMGFFRGMGFDLPARKGVPDFLQEVTGRKDQKVGWQEGPAYNS